MNKDISMSSTPYRSVIIGSFFLLLLFYANTTLRAQNVTETRWYFGNSVENLVFDRNGRDVTLQTDQAVPFGIGGSVTITDQFSGNLLFYSDGSNVYDASHSIVPSGAGLSGNTSINVPVVTCPVTNNPGQYYLFTNSGAGGVNEIQYSVVDASVIGNGSAQFPHGDVISTNVSSGLINPSEGMLIVPAGDGELFWLISQNSSTFQIQVTRIDANGVGVPTPYDFTDGTTPGFEASSFSYNSDSSKLVMAPKLANRNIWLMDFDPLSGTLAFDEVLSATGFGDDSGESIYDIEWSPDGSKIYFSRFGSSGVTAQLYQVDFNDTTLSVNPILPTPVYRSFGIKKAPDNRIYHLYQGANGDPINMGRLNRPDSIVDSVQYQSIVFPENFNAHQFSEHTPAYDFTFDSLDFYWIDSCLTNVTKFFPIVEPVPNSIEWNFNDESQSSNWIVNNEFLEEGTKTVTLTAEVNGIRKSVMKDVDILANDLMVDIGNDTTICVDDVLQLDAGEGESYVWSTGEFSQTIQVDTTGTYWVEVTNQSGCTGYAEIAVTEYGVSNQTSNQWYFGEQAGIEFTNGPIAILDGNQQSAPEGCATISDVNGDLLFYTNGFTVWNKEHDVMLNGEDIGGDLVAAQNALIMPYGDDPTMFFLFTTDQVYGDDEYALRYSIVDMKEDTARGKVIVKNVKLMDRGTERITGSGFTGNDLIVSHEFGNNTFRSYRTSPEGLSGAIYSPVGEVHDFMQELSATGYMKVSPTLNQVAVNIPGTNQVEIFDFDQGVVSNPRLIDTGEADLYGLEFSPGGTKLYLTTSSAASKLIQYDLDSLDSNDPATDIAATKFDGYAQGANYGALQLGPNGIVYMAVDNSGSIGEINAPEGDNDAASFDEEGFDLEGRISRLGLPNFAQNQSPPLQEPSMTVTAGCAGQASVFRGSGRDPNNQIENYLWIFGDGTSATVQDTTHVYAVPGTYNVQLVLSNRCDVDTTLTQSITINNIPESPTVPTDTALCDQAIVLTAWPVDNPDFSYYWSTGESTREISVSEPAVIDVAIINNLTGCTSDTLQVFLADARPEVQLGADRVICQNGSTSILDPMIARGTYSWAVDGVVLSSNATFNIDTTTVGTFEYTVAVTNSLGCVGRDTIQVTIQPAPDITVNPNPTSGCGINGNNDGSLDIAFNTSGSYSYQLFGSIPFGPANIDGPSTAPSITGLTPGNYSVLVTNLVSGCTYLEVVQVEDPGSFDLIITSTGTCDNDVDLTIAGTSGLPANYDYEILYENGQVASQGTNISVDPLVVENLSPGTFAIEVTERGGNGCIETEQITVNAGTEPDFTFDAIQEICGTQGAVSVMDSTGGAAIYSWAGAGIVGTNIGTSIQVDQAGTYTVTADQGAGFCTRVEEIQVNFNPDPVVDVTIEGDPCDGEIILVANVTNGSGTYIYTWSDGSQSMRNGVTVSGTYTVTVLDQVTGCEVISSAIDVNVQSEFTVDLSLSPDCSNNSNVFLAAIPNYYHPGISYEWQNAAGERLADSDSILTINTSGLYTVVVTNELGTCVINETQEVTIIPILEEDLLLPETASFCSGNPENPLVELNPGIFNTYEWRLLPDEAVISTDPVLTVSSSGTYEVTLYNGFTCTTDQVVVTEGCRPTIVAPNAFSPNGNGINEEFFVYPNEYVDQFQILIYTRWGELIYTSEDKDFRWDGIYKGSLLPSGTFAYVMKFSSTRAPELGTIEQFGSITLIR